MSVVYENMEVTEAFAGLFDIERVNGAIESVCEVLDDKCENLIEAHHVVRSVYVAMRGMMDERLRNALDESYEGVPESAQGVGPE